MLEIQQVFVDTHTADLKKDLESLEKKAKRASKQTDKFASQGALNSTSKAAKSGGVGRLMNNGKVVLIAEAFKVCARSWLVIIEWKLHLDECMASNALNIRSTPPTAVSVDLPYT
eukprot:577121-Amorphochlora_amoeboformis.AAC.1